MHREQIEIHLIWGAGSLVFMITLIMVASASSSIVLREEHNGNSTHYIIDTSDFPDVIIHTIAYYIACFATTMFLLICALIILSLATLVMELLVEAFHFLRSRHEQRVSRRQQDEQVSERLDTYCDSWNYR